jgi:hypothetical protein
MKKKRKRVDMNIFFFFYHKKNIDVVCECFIERIIFRFSFFFYFELNKCI